MDIFVLGGNVNWWALFGRQFGSYSQNENFLFPLTQQVKQSNSSQEVGQYEIRLERGCSFAQLISQGN